LIKDDHYLNVKQDVKSSFAQRRVCVFWGSYSVDLSFASWRQFN